MKPLHVRVRAGSAIGILLLGLLIFGTVRYDRMFMEYYGRAAAANANAQFLAASNTGRSADIVTIVGTEIPVRPADRRIPDQWAWVKLDRTGTLVALAGERTAVCNGDAIAVTGSYAYDREGGVLTVSDRRNVSPRFHSYAPRWDRTLRGLFPAWCGFPGMPVNDVQQ